MRLPVTIRLGDSNHSTALLVAAHGIALLAIAPLDWLWPLRLMLAGAVVISLPICLMRTYRREFAQLHLGVRGELEVESKVGVRRTVALDPQTTILPGCIVLLLHDDERCSALPVFADATDGDGFRRLRLWLRQRADC